MRKSLRITKNNPEGTGGFASKVMNSESSICSEAEKVFRALDPDFPPLFKGDIPMKQGELFKLGKKHKRETMRFYLLKQNTLIMFLNKKNRNPRRVYFLKGAYVEPKDNLGISIFHECRHFSSLELYAETETARDEWM